MALVVFVLATIVWAGGECRFFVVRDRTFFLKSVLVGGNKYYIFHHIYIYAFSSPPLT